MKKLKFIILILIFSVLIIGCQEKKFSFEEKYYNNSEIIELDLNNFNKLIENKESFGIFIYQPMCVTSNEFSEIIKEYSENYLITFYKMPFSLIKETKLEEQIKYYPSFVIYRNGELIDFLDASSDEDTNYYKSIDGFKEWLETYVTIK